MCIKYVSSKDYRKSFKIILFLRIFHEARRVLYICVPPSVCHLGTASVASAAWTGEGLGMGMVVVAGDRSS